MLLTILIRYLYAIGWTCLLAGFSYGELIGHFFEPNPTSFDDKIVAMLSTRFMIFSNAGLVMMLFVDSHITKKITKDSTPHKLTGLLLTSLIIVITLAVLADEIKNGSMVFPDWFHLYYLCLIFLACLAVYKAEALNIKRVSLSISHSTA